MSCRHIFQNVFPKTLHSGRKVLFSFKRYYTYRRVCCSSAAMFSFDFVKTRRFKINSREDAVPWLVLRRSYHKNDSNPVNSVWRRRLWRIIRGVFFTTGAIAWTLVILAYVALEKVDVDVQGDSSRGLNGLEQKLMNHFYKEKNEAGILKKDEALERIWKKLSQEDRVKEVFGHPAYICGYNYSGKIERLLADVDDFEAENHPSESTEFLDSGTPKSTKKSEKQESEIMEDKKWEAGCYIEGSKNVGLMKVIFEEHKHEWVPIALHLETLVNSGNVITDVSASLPNGIKNFTRLAN